MGTKLGIAKVKKVRQAHPHTKFFEVLPPPTGFLTTLISLHFPCRIRIRNLPGVLLGVTLATGSGTSKSNAVGSSSLKKKNEGKSLDCVHVRQRKKMFNLRL